VVTHKGRFHCIKMRIEWSWNKIVILFSSGAIVHFQWNMQASTSFNIVWVVVPLPKCCSTWVQCLSTECQHQTTRHYTQNMMVSSICTRRGTKGLTSYTTNYLLGGSLYKCFWRLSSWFLDSASWKPLETLTGRVQASSTKCRAQNSFQLGSKSWNANVWAVHLC
jgi:hypothetical protein